MLGNKFCAICGFVAVAFIPVDAQTVVEIEDAVTSPGGTATSRVFLTHDQPLQGFQVEVLYDSAILRLERISLQNTDVERLSPEIFETAIHPSDFEPGTGSGRAAVLFDFEAPFRNPFLSPGERRPILAFHFESLGDPELVGTCTAIELAGGPAETTVDGEVCFVGAPLFRRGDSNADGAFDLADAVFTLQYLFLGGPEPDCEKSADADDSGTIELTDAIFVLNHLFLGGDPPSDPFGVCGIDPTEDDLSCGVPGCV